MNEEEPPKKPSRRLVIGNNREHVRGSGSATHVRTPSDPAQKNSITTSDRDDDGSTTPAATRVFLTASTPTLSVQQRSKSDPHIIKQKLVKHNTTTRTSQHYPESQYDVEEGNEETIVTRELKYVYNMYCIFIWVFYFLLSSYLLLLFNIRCNNDNTLLGLLLLLLIHVLVRLCFLMPG